MQPPKTTEGTSPMSRAARPLSKAPISLLEPMKTWFTEETRPSMCSGVSVCSRVARSTTLTLSTAPLAASRRQLSRKLRLRAKAMVARPKAATQISSVRPARRRGGRWAMVIPMITEPTAGAARRTPSPCGPALRTSLAKTGSTATAPPNSTANRSRLMALSSSRWEKTKRSPSARLVKMEPT